MAPQALPQKGLTDREGDEWMDAYVIVKTLGDKKFYKPWGFVLGVGELDAVQGKLPLFHRNLRDDVAGNHLEYLLVEIPFFGERSRVFYGVKLDIMGIGDNDRSKTKNMGKRKSKETGVVEEVLDNIVEVDENRGRKKDLEQEVV
ncbi:hypothetical protein ABVK25_006253 [Lepraria finkii]|uniref:Uncharacterized protein n=1 Tax=Lepraria finkii TaxID=1340010 RepID=A0ABR4B6W5_9LECA